MLAVFGVMSVATYFFLPDMVQKPHEDHRGVFVDRSDGSRQQGGHISDANEEEESKDVDLAIDALSRDADRVDDELHDPPFGRLPERVSLHLLLFFFFFFFFRD